MRGWGLCPSATAPEAPAPVATAPVPVVTIDNLSDPLSTIVEISFGDLLGELLDTVRGREAGRSVRADTRPPARLLRPRRKP